MDAAAIERFSGPPLAERAYVSDQARACVVRPGNDDLQTLVLRDLPGDAREALAWDAWRRTDGRWTVIAAVGDAAPLSTWIYDPRSRSVQPEDAASHRLASEDVVVPLRANTSTVTLERENPQETIASDVPEPAEESPRETSPAPTPVEPSSESDVTPPARSKSRKGRRASVPRWDEILFGAGQTES